ncbi:MAG: hypothetical protein L3J97_07370, partial [Thermoplasmata archaeon]|nr:hypothetical protein [Thermoplasmata archaeon]
MKHPAPSSTNSSRLDTAYAVYKDETRRRNGALGGENLPPLTTRYFDVRIYDVSIRRAVDCLAKWEFRPIVSLPRVETKSEVSENGHSGPKQEA